MCRPSYCVYDNLFHSDCAHMCSWKFRAKCPNFGNQAKQHLWEVSEGVYKQFNQLNGVTRSIYCEYGDKMDQFAPAPATCQ